MKKLVSVLPLCLLAFFVASTGQSQPANDDFANAWLLVGKAASTNGNSNAGTKETGEPNHAGLVGGRSVWFNWVAPTNGATRLDTSGSAFNTLLGVYAGSAVGSLTLVASNDNGAGLAGGAS